MQISFTKKSDVDPEDKTPPRQLKVSFSGSYTIDTDELLSSLEEGLYYYDEHGVHQEADLELPDEQEFRMMPTGQIANLISRLSSETKGEVSAEYFLSEETEWDSIDLSITEAEAPVDTTE